MSKNQADHLFISYASEDYELAEWLTLKLTAEGYKVWCDRVHLLGGESYPRDIDLAIKQRTFRLLALLSRHSIAKPNPLKERTLALNLGRERGVDFLVPLNVDGLSPTELDWMTSDLTFIPFHQSWASGFAQLLKKLDSINAPRGRVDGREAVYQWYASCENVFERQEILWTNLLEIVELPRMVLRFSLKNERSIGWAEVWPHFLQNPTAAWAFEYPPDTSSLSQVGVEEIEWERQDRHLGVGLIGVVTYLVKQHLISHCRQKGMAISDEKHDLYFPPSLISGDRLSFTGYDGRGTWVQVVGERTFRLGDGLREKTIYHLSPIFRPMLRAFGRPVVQIQLRVHLTDTRGVPLETPKAVRRRKSICKHWWNHQWLSRLIGICAWLGDGNESFALAENTSGRLLLSGIPIRLSSPVGINEEALGPVSFDEDTEMPDEDVDQDAPEDSGIEGDESGQE